MKHLAVPGSIALVIIALIASSAYKAHLKQERVGSTPERVLCVEAVASDCDDLPGNPMEFASCIATACGEPPNDQPKQVQEQDPATQEGQAHDGEDDTREAGTEGAGR